MVDLLDNFLNLIRLFLAVASNIMKSYDREWEVVRRERPQIGFLRSGERWGKGLKQKLLQTESAIKNIKSQNSTQCNAEYLGFPGIK
jgi:hypothetical protein